MSSSNEQGDDNNELLMQSFIDSLSLPEQSLMPLFWPGQQDQESLHRQRQQLRKVCQILFRQVEGLAKAHDAVMNKDDDAPPTVLSGLDELYIGPDDQPVDAETLWGQAELQNEALHTRIKKCMKKVIKAVDSQQDGEPVRLLDMGDIVGDDDSDNGDESDEEEESDDEETKRMRARMERAMADMDESDEEGSEQDDQETAEAEGQEAKEDDDESSLEDPAAEELNDGFFDIQEMEAFADEEEEYLPEQAFGTVKPEDDEADGEPKKTFHQRQREGDVDSGDDDDEDEDGLTFRAPESTVRRRKYRTDQEIDALYSFYQEAPDENEDDDSVINMTAADLFGMPNKKYFDKWNKKSRSEKKQSADDDDADSWDDHDFGDEGPGWSDQQETNKKKVSFGKDTIEDRDDDSGSDDDDDDDDEAVGREAKQEPEETITPSTSSHAKQSAKLRRQTEQLEKELLAEKPWQMSGETKSTSRPANSLLEATPEFEVATKMAPLITVEHTANLEDVIKKRILDEDWDDVIPRELPDVAWNKKRGELPEVSQEKSKLGLGALYEREYLKKAVGYDVDSAEKETEEEKAKNEMKALFANLCSKLDALSNYHFAPRPVADEAEVRAVTTPAIAMEEVLPLHVSDKRGVAPEEVYGTKKGRDGILRGDSELDQTERKRLRAAKKAARRKARKAKKADEKLLSKLQPGLGLNNPYEKRKMQEDLSVAQSKGKITVGQRDGHDDYGASGKFFRRMQEQVEQSVHGDDSKKRKRSQDDAGRPKSSALKL